MKRWLVVSMFVAVLSFSIIASAEISKEIPTTPIFFVKIVGLAGKIIIEDESKVQRYEKQTEGLRFTYGASNAGSASRAVPGVPGAARPTQETVMITKMTSASTPKLFEAVWTGKPIPEMFFSFVKPGPGGPEMYYGLRLTNVTVTGIHQFSDGSRLLEDVGIAAGKVEILYRKAGSAGSTDIKFGYDFQMGKEF